MTKQKSRRQTGEHQKFDAFVFDYELIGASFIEIGRKMTEVMKI